MKVTIPEHTSYTLGTNEQGETVILLDAMMDDPATRLIPNGIENFIPRCIVCTSPVPAKRATSRSKDTCGPECHKVLRAYRKHVLKSTKCPACYHPSTPAERKEFQNWRKARGDRRHSVGRPKQNHEDRLRKILIRITDFLESAELYSKDEERDAIVKESKELIDNVGNGAPTLTPERVNPDEGAKTDAI
jgi:hypothetical protein